MKFCMIIYKIILLKHRVDLVCSDDSAKQEQIGEGN